MAVANLISKYTGIDEIRALQLFYIANEGIPKKPIEILEQLQDKDK